MPNMAAIISRHNKVLLAQRTEPANTVPPCNRRAKTIFPMKGQCHESSIIYKATLTSDGIQGVRTGSREPVLGISARLANPFLEF